MDFAHRMREGRLGNRSGGLSLRLRAIALALRALEAARITSGFAVSRSRSARACASRTNATVP